MNTTFSNTFFIGLIIYFSVHFYSFAADATDFTPVSQNELSSFNADSATREYLDLLTPEQKVRSDKYFEGGYWILIIEFILEIIIAWIFLSLGLSKWIHKIALKAKRTNIQNTIYILLYLVLVYVISFPLSVYTDFIREHQFGLSNMSFTEWFSESMISFTLVLLFMGLLIVLLYMIMRKSARQWWIICSGVVTGFLIIVLFITPVFISPLFNDYKPLEAGSLRDEILSLARANGVPAKEIYQFNASKQSTRISANVSGLGSTIRISLNDNLLNNCPPDEIKAVMAHELGHYVLNHVVKMLVAFGILVFVGFAFVKWLMEKALKRYGEKWTIRGISDIKSLPLFVLMFALYIFLASPVINNIIRINEVEADIFGLNAAREPDGFAKVAMKLSDYRKINPGRLEEIIFFDHPSGKSRVFMSMRWKAENK